MIRKWEGGSWKLEVFLSHFLLPTSHFAERSGAGRDAIDIGGYDIEKSKKFRDVARSGRAAFVVDDVVSRSPWRARGVEVRGRAEATNGERPFIRIHPDRIVSWGLSEGAGHSARSVE